MENDQLEWLRIQDLPLADARDTLTCGLFSPEIADAVTSVMVKARHGEGGASTPLQDLQRILEGMRGLPPSLQRVREMNTFVRTLGLPENLATLLDVLRTSLTGDDDREAALSGRSRRGRMHCVYGWAGQTLLLASYPDATTGTVPPVDDMDEFLGYPPAEWDMSIHIWQPNPGVQGFSSMKRVEPGVIVEPPHSHPFSFVSFVSKGQLHESIYAEDTNDRGPASPSAARYAGVMLQKVDGVWPPHQKSAPQRLRTLEERVLLRQGHSYFLPAHAIHDVEVERQAAARTPAVTLFLCAEATEKPRVYMAPDMAEYHRLNPDLKDVAIPLETWQWEEKLMAVSRYLRDESPELRLDEVFECNTTYGFMHT